MGLFDNLPCAKRSFPDTERDGSPEPKRPAVAADTGEAPPPSSGPTTTTEIETAPNDLGATDDPPKKPADHAEALERLATHMRNPKKFKRACALATEVMASGSLERRHGKAVFACLLAAMSPSPKKANDPATRFEYKTLFIAALQLQHDGVFNVKHKAQLAVWVFYAHLVNDLFTDDAFTFAKTLKAIQVTVANAPAYRRAPTEESFNKEKDEQEIEPGTGGGGGGDLTTSDATVSPEETTQRLASENQMRRAEFAADCDRWRLEDELREAAVWGLECASDRYNKAWAQTGIDIAVDEVHAGRVLKFSAEQQQQIVSTWDLVRRKRNARRKNSADIGGALTTFDRGSKAFANASVSIRGGLGGEGTRDGRGESALR